MEAQKTLDELVSIERATQLQKYQVQMIADLLNRKDTNKQRFDDREKQLDEHITKIKELTSIPCSDECSSVDCCEPTTPRYN
jgi:hypothetical protein